MECCDDEAVYFDYVNPSTSALEKMAHANIIYLKKGNECTIENNAEYDAPIFFHVNAVIPRIILCKNIYTLINLENEKFNLNYFKDFLTIGEVYCGETPWRNIFKLLPGFYTRIDFQRPWPVFRLHYGYFFKKKQRKPAAILKNYINQYCHQRHIVIEYSGGLDSNALLYTARESRPKKNLRALTWYHPNISSKDDINIAQQTCEQLGIEHIKHAIDISDLFGLDSFDKNITAPNLSLAFYKIRQQGHQRCSADHNDICYINGHGGDHLFFDPPDYSTIINAYLDKGVKFAIKKLYEYSLFTGLPISHIVKKCFIIGVTPKNINSIKVYS